MTLKMALMALIVALMMALMALEVPLTGRTDADSRKNHADYREESVCNTGIICENGYIEKNGFSNVRFTGKVDWVQGGTKRKANWKIIR